MQPEEIIVLQKQLAEYDDTKAFEALYMYFYKKLLHFAISFTKQRETAEEIVADVFIKLWEKRESAAGIRNLQVYLFIAIRNRALNFLEWKSRNVLSYFESYPENIQAFQTTPESVLMTREMADRINKAVDSLPPKCKVIFKLVREEGMKYREVAEILGISPRTVDTQMTIATKKLAAAITLYTTSATW